MARPGWPERNKAARSFRQLRRFRHVINSDKVFGTHTDHQQIYRELARLRDRGHIQGREVVQSGKPNKLVYTLTSEGRAALRHWAARPSSPSSIKDDLLVRLYALDSVDIDSLRADL